MNWHKLYVCYFLFDTNQPTTLLLWELKLLELYCPSAPVDIHTQMGGLLQKGDKEIFCISTPPDRSWSGLGLWPAAQFSICSAGGRAPQQTGLEKGARSRRGEETIARCEKVERGIEREMLGAEGRALTPSIACLMRRSGAVVLLLGVII